MTLYALLPISKAITTVPNAGVAIIGRTKPYGEPIFFSTEGEPVYALEQLQVIEYIEQTSIECADKTPHYDLTAEEARTLLAHSEKPLFQ